MIEAFIAEVKSTDQIGWLVTPKIINNDGQPHDDISVISRPDIDPQIGDIVFILTIKNNLDLTDINQYFEPSKANGVIIGIATSMDSKFYFEGDRIINGLMEVKGNTRGLITYTEANTGLQAFITDLNSKLATALTAAGSSWPGTSLDISSAETNNIKTGPEAP